MDPLPCTAARGDVFRFLDLPAGSLSRLLVVNSAPLINKLEIRNHIYSYANENGSRLHTRISPTQGATSPHWKLLKRTFLGLTRTCRAIRHEYMPTFADNYFLEVSRAHVPAFLDQLVPKDATRRAAFACILVLRTYRVPKSIGSPGEINVIPLLELSAIAKRFIPCVYSDYLSSTNNSVAIMRLDPIQWSASWQDLALIKLKELVISPYHTYLRVELVVKQGLRKKWNQRWPLITVKNDLRDDLITWARRRGMRNCVQSKAVKFTVDFGPDE